MEDIVSEYGIMCDKLEVIRKGKYDPIEFELGAEKEQGKKMERPFDGETIYYKYRCSDCGYEQIHLIL